VVVPHYPTRFSCTCFARLRELGGDAFSSDAALSGPDDQGAAPVDPELLVQRGHMVAHRVAGELELDSDLGIALALADEGKHLALSRRQISHTGSHRR
jgi:hypothetical protein